MKKKYLIILGVILAVLCIFTGLLLSGIFNGNNNPKDETTQPDTSVNGDGSKVYDLSAFEKNIGVSLPLLPTDIDGIYYTMSSLGEVGFYSINGTQITSVAETGVYDISVECSNVSIPAKVHYIDYEGQKFGCGLYTSSITSGVNLYAYAFFKLTELPEAFKSENEYWLLLDVEQTRFYSADKVYGEAFYYNAEENTSEHFLSETQRTIAMSGIYRADYKVFTEEILRQPQDNVLFFSGRFYSEDLDRYDVFSSGGYDLNTDNLRMARDVLDMALFRTEDKFYYLKADSATDGFFVCSYDEEETQERLYAFNFEKNCIRSGEYFYEKTASDIYNIIDGTTAHLVTGKAGVLNANIFELSENGKYAFLRGDDAEGNIWIVAANLQSGKSDVFCNEEFAKIAACNVSDDGLIQMSVSDSLTPTVSSVYYQLLLNIGDNSEEQVTGGDTESAVIEG